MTKLSETGELGLLAELERRGLIVGVEHDAAVVGGLVVTQDALVEGVHFLLDRLTWRELGFRAAAVNISDLAASGALPEALLVASRSRARPRSMTSSRSTKGSPRPVCRSSAATRPRLRSRASASPRSVAATTCRDGRVRSRATRSSSPVRSARREPHFAAGATSRPPLRVEEGRELARTAHAQLDVSDGLAVDPGHIAATLRRPLRRRARARPARRGRDARRRGLR